MNVAVDDTTGEAVISVAGDLDMTVEDEVIATMRQTVDNPNISSLRVDATQVGFIDSSGVRSLLAGLQAAADRGISFTLEIAPDGCVAKLLTLVGLDQHFGVDRSD